MLGYRTTRALVAIMAVALIATTLAPAAEAGHRHGHRYKKDADDSHGSRGGGAYRQVSYQQPHRRGSFRVQGGYQSRVVEVHHHSSSNVVPVLAGLIGGIAIGAAIAHHHDHAFVDSYCGQRYGSLEDCQSHYKACRHPRVVQEIDSRGRCVDTYRMQAGGWVDTDRTYERDRGYDDGAYDDGYDEQQYDDDSRDDEEDYR